MLVYDQYIWDLENKKASTDREYSPFYNSVFLIMAVDRQSILFVSCAMTSIECNNSDIILNELISKFIFF